MRKIILPLLALAPLAACDKKPAAPPAPPPAHVSVVVLHPQAVTLRTELPGRADAYKVAQIRPQVSGVILRRLFREGETVPAGRQLYQIDPRPYQAALASAEAGEEKARAVIASSQALNGRYAKLARAQAVSRQDYDNAHASLLQNQADLLSAAAQVRTARINLAYTRMYAPISGRTGRSEITEGALVTADQAAPLATVTQLDPIYVDVTQPAETLLRLRRELAAGSLEAAGPEAALVHLTLDDGSAYPLPGKLLFSEVTVDPATGSVILRALFPNPDGLLLPGMFAHETIVEGVRRAGLLVPQRGVEHDAHGDPVALVVGTDGAVVQRKLATDRTVGTDWLVSAGLSPGDRVIVEGLQSARPGAKVAAQEVTLGADGAPKPVAPKAGKPGR